MRVVFSKSQDLVFKNETTKDDKVKIEKLEMNVKSDLNAKVENFDQYGRLRIEFSEVMNTTLGFKGLNSSISFLHQN